MSNSPINSSLSSNLNDNSSDINSLDTFATQEKQLQNTTVPKSLPVKSKMPVKVCDIEESKYYHAAPPRTCINRQAGITYYRQYIKYNYGTVDYPVLDTPLHELNICRGMIRMKKTNTGIQWKLNLTILDKQDLEGLKRISAGIKRVIKSTWNESHGIVPELVDRTVQDVYFYPSDPNTKQRIVGADPMLSLRISDSSAFKALDKDMNDVPVDYTTLLNKRIECSVIFEINNICKATVFGPQLYVKSCYVLSPDTGSTVNHSASDYLQQYIAKNPEAIGSIIEKLEELKRAQQENLLTADTAKEAQNAQPQAHADGMLNNPSVPMMNPQLNLPQMNAPMNPQMKPQINPQMNPHMSPQMNPHISPQMNVTQPDISQGYTQQMSNRGQVPNDYSRGYDFQQQLSRVPNPQQPEKNTFNEPPGPANSYSPGFYPPTQQNYTNLPANRQFNQHADINTFLNSAQLADKRL